MGVGMGGQSLQTYICMIMSAGTEPVAHTNSFLLPVCVRAGVCKCVRVHSSIKVMRTDQACTDTNKTTHN